MSESLRIAEEITHDKLTDKFVREVEPKIKKKKSYKRVFYFEYPCVLFLAFGY